MRLERGQCHLDFFQILSNLDLSCVKLICAQQITYECHKLWEHTKGKMHKRGIASPIVGRAAYVPPKQDFTETLFNKFVKAQSFKGTLSSFFALCEQVKLEQFKNHSTFFTSLKEGVKCWRANSLWSSLTPLAGREVYGGGSICARQRILIIGAGPCGLRTAIECAFLGAKVVVVEKRDDFYRNNVLHLWPFVIKDLRKLGAKILYPKFCPGNINHISIRKLQLLLLKICLCLGVEVHQRGFVDIVEPPEDQSAGNGWRAKLEPEDRELSTFEFDVVIGADGRRNSLKGFERKKAGRALAIAITFNFVNYNTSEEAKVSEIGGISYQFRQDFFQEMKNKHGIELENLVYYKDETHYFVVTAKKASLLGKGVLKEDKPTVDELLSEPNVDRDQLKTYALELAKFCTTLPSYDFEVNHHGSPDVAMFDFTSVFQACHPAIIRDKNGHKLLAALVGDGLYQPFWPQGTGCGRGFLSAFNAAWMIRDWVLGEKEPLNILAERESLYLLLPMTPQGLSPAIDRYSIDPESRYVGLKTQTRVGADEVEHLYNPEEHGTVKRKRREFADPWESVINSAQRNHFTNNLSSRQSSGDHSESEVDAKASRNQVSGNKGGSNDGDQAIMRYGQLRKVQNSLVAADAEEEMRRNKELNDERERERKQIQGLNDSEMEIKQDVELNFKGQRSGNQALSDFGEETNCNEKLNDADQVEIGQAKEPSDVVLNQASDEGQVARRPTEEQPDSEEIRCSKELNDDRDRRRTTQELSHTEEQPKCNKELSIDGQVMRKKIIERRQTQERPESQEEINQSEEFNNGRVGEKLPDSEQGIKQTRELNVKGQVSGTQKLFDFVEETNCNEDLTDVGQGETEQAKEPADLVLNQESVAGDEKEMKGRQNQGLLDFEGEIRCNEELSDERQMERRHTQELPNPREETECNRDLSDEEGQLKMEQTQELLAAEEEDQTKS